ncbi:F-box associated interaction domain [Arabidopsis suecica]|uniref:F-box associated interaction domain n=1 Tax=Arabidopsis suecica TaxID=45249 RepID=A0A8T2BVB5_ARASU|nr:F-box associated interaction domain [Arabidopsis suecica]
MAPSTVYSRYYYFGYDHVMNQYKVLAMTIYWQELTQNFHVFTLGRDFHQWRNIQGNIDEKFIPIGRAGVCIDGIIYYEAISSKESFNYRKTMLLSFDIRSERFYHVRAPDTWINEISDPNWTDQNLFNHQGKLGCIGCNENNTNMWIMENVEKQEWSKITFGLLKYPGGDFSTSSGVTPAGEIFVVQHVWYPYNMPLYFDYYNMKEKSFRRVEIEGARLEATKQAGGIRVFAIHDYVENTMWF